NGNQVYRLWTFTCCAHKTEQPADRSGRALFSGTTESSTTMIIARLRCGLGNQMFQYATAKALALRHGCRFALYAPRFRRHPPDRPYALDCFAPSPPRAHLRDFGAFTGGPLALPVLRRRIEWH